jgi:hypothetical protein
MARNLEEYTEYIKNINNDLLIELYRYNISLMIDNKSNYNIKEYYENKADACKEEMAKRMNYNNLITAANKLVCTIKGNGTSNNINSLL